MTEGVASVFRRMVWVALAVPFQILIGPKLAILGFQPSFLLALFVLFSIRNGSFAGIWVGFAIGLVFDVYQQGVPGAYVLALAVLGWIAGFFDEKHVHTEYSTRVLILGLGCLLHDSLWFLMGHHQFQDLPSFLLRISAPSALYTMMVGAAIYALRPPVRRERRW
ncbi:MAG: rod shape-determining protein MreD [Fibrobacteria bacterium]|nr:rod shape-determining protein MreD [Fibrobacteria bacterium]